MKLDLKDDVIQQTFFWMLIFGVFIGSVFPFFSDHFLGLPKNIIYSLTFFVTCIISGIIVGLLGFLIVKITIIKRLASLKEKIDLISSNIQNYREGKIQDVESCTDCFLEQNMDVYGLGTKYNLLISIIREFFWQYQKSDEFYVKLNKSIETDELNSNFARFVTDNFKCLGVEIFYLDKSSNLNTTYSYLAREDLSDKQKESIKNIIEKDRLFSLKDANITLTFGTLNIVPQEVLFVPILSQKKEKYLVTLYFSDYLKQDSVNFFKRLIYQYSMALERSNIYRDVQKIAAIDELTGIYNRRFGMQRLIEDYSRAKRNNSPFYVMMFDIDHFKVINDTYGHQAGDFILENVAKLIKGMLRIEDVFLRYGGEEFLAGLICKMESVIEKADVIRKTIEKTPFLFGNEEVYITISVGLSKTQPNDATTVNHLIKEADEALYEAKNSGRNRVCIR